MAISDIMGLLGRAGESIGGGTSGIYTGLLSEDELRAAKNRAATKALFDLSASMAEAGRPQAGRPMSTFGALAKGLSAAQEGYQGTLQQQAKEKLAANELAQKLASQKRTAEAQRLAQGIFTPATPAQPAPYLAGAPYGKATPAQPGGFNQEAIQQLMTTSEGRAALQEIMGARKAMQPEMFSVGEGATQYSIGPFTSAITQVASGAPKMSDLERQYAFAKTPQGGSYAGTFEQFKAISAPKTTNIVNPLQPDKGLVGKLQESLVTAGDRKMRYSQIESSYRPEFSTVPYRSLQAWNSLKDRAGLLDEDEKANLAGYTQWRQNTMTNLAKTINEISGTAAGEAEVDRLRKTMPDSGTGVFDGDSPTEFEAKTKETLRQLRMIEARTTYLLRNGLTLDKVPLDRMPQIINERGKQIATQYKLDPSKPRDLELIKKQLSAEFGISTQ